VLDERDQARRELEQARQELRRHPGTATLMTEDVIGTVSVQPRPQAWWVSLAVLGGVVAVAALLVAGALLLEGQSRGTRTIGSSGGPALVSRAQLAETAASADHPVYWAGPKDGFSYELTKAENGRIFIRYLPPGVKGGDRRADFLTVGTYPQPESFIGLKRAARRPGAVSIRIANGGVVVFDSKKPSSVYFAYPNAKYQVEVFAPSGQTALSLVLTGKIKPIL
jgi:hypothetical protein